MESNEIIKKKTYTSHQRRVPLTWKHYLLLYIACGAPVLLCIFLFSAPSRREKPFDRFCWINQSGKKWPQQFHKIQRNTVCPSCLCGEAVQQHHTIVFLHSHSAVSDFYPLRSLLKLRSSFIPALTAGANSCIHLCCRTVNEPDCDPQTFKMITFFFCLFISLCASLSLIPLHFLLFFCLLIYIAIISFLVLFLHHHPGVSLTIRSVSFSLFVSPSGLRQIVLSEESNRASGQQVFCLSHGESLYVCGKVLNSGHHLLSCHSLWPKNREWGLVDSWLDARCRERCNGWDLDITASSDAVAAEAGQGSEAYCQMYSITEDDYSQFLELWIAFNLMERNIASHQGGPRFECSDQTRCLSVWGSHVLPVPDWVFSECPSFLPQSKDIQLGLLVTSP